MSLDSPAIGLPWSWGATEGAQAPEPLRDDGGEQRRLAARAVVTSATPEALFLWLCQLRRAPYSYDWIDNFGKRSPRTPDPAMTALEAGQEVMTIFSLIGFEPNRSMTIQMRQGWPTHIFGSIIVRYSIIPTADGRALLRGDLWMPPIGRVLKRVRRGLLAWGDLLMMCKQLRTLSTLAEVTSTSPEANDPTPNTR